MACADIVPTNDCSRSVARSSPVHPVCVVMDTADGPRLLGGTLGGSSDYIVLSSLSNPGVSTWRPGFGESLIISVMVYLPTTGAFQSLLFLGRGRQPLKWIAMSMLPSAMVPVVGVMVLLFGVTGSDSSPLAWLWAALAFALPWVVQALLLRHLLQETGSVPPREPMEPTLVVEHGGGQ